jgi:hypothetical protein
LPTAVKGRSRVEVIVNEPARSRLGFVGTSAHALKCGDCAVMSCACRLRRTDRTGVQ